MRKVIITCAITGAVHTPSMSPYLPKTPDEIAQAAIDAAEAGAAIVHLHARDPETGIPSQDPAIFARFLPRIAQESAAVINITTGGAPTMTIEERLRPATIFKPEIASLNMGSMNFVLYEMLNRFKEFKYDWEEPYLRASDQNIFRNTYRDIEHILRTCGDQGTRFEIECYDVSHLYTAAYFRDRGLLTGPIFLQTVFGIRGGIGAHYEDIAMMKRTADRLFGPDDYVWSVLGGGRNQMPIATISAALGGNVRVGLEDSLWGEPGQLARSNAEQARRIRTVLEALSLEIATPDDARDLLKLKGSTDVGAMM
ncbi:MULTISPECIES: 3-keto-5-aminohexanoate cleavage protein [unclassified Sphingomonas]|uniref:3-keto-5-aminohexanoate cleavage protein n=1 Tax=unclassified Sphingomonas TaxID=196159 RepID=UPI0009279659|nr:MULTISPECIES: 3-keto-5-aminohexanoate cleavage protein [unclassified Sphingomonas]MBN8850052.1 3-keto-5-aminohexanoate cleavage protein [Sphingomonas sp.]OJV32419.1 MAG: 3-keto-5-aminohexanoate cleavage protein [Sphingomonas sp. 67-36]